MITMSTRSPRLALLAALLALALLALTPGTDRAAADVAPGPFTGKGFDTCTAPTSATMDAWLSSPYRAVGIYFGGSNRACSQPALTAAWVERQQGKGWHLLPIYLGLQASCTTSNKKNLLNPATAAAQGRAEADAAVTAAGALGLSKGSTLIFDMEAYAPNNPACTSAVLAFLGAWTARLHDRGYLSGVYGSLGSTVRDLVKDYNSVARPHPDYLFFARWDGIATVDNAAIPAAYWNPDRRIHQYRGDHQETHGGVTINIDNDYVDVKPLPGARFNDFTKNGWSDLIGRDRATGDVYLYPGNGTDLGARTRIGTGWTQFTELTRSGDFTGDGRNDLIGRDSATGYLWLYPGTGTGLAPRIRLGTGWNAMREITAAGDLDSDGRRDLLAVQKSTGYLFFYPGRGTSLGPRVRIGTGWDTMSELTGIGNLVGDGHRDLLARHTATGTLYLYPGKGVGFAPRVKLSTGWSGLRSLTPVGDFDRDNKPDLMAIGTSSGSLYLYRGRAGGLHPGIRLSGGWSERGPIF